MRSLKTLGVALVAALALSVIGASAASAASFTSESEPTTFSGSQVTKNVFTADTGNVECTGANFEGTAAKKTESEVTITPTYSGCTAFGFSATVTMNGCTYTMYAAGSADLVCPSGKDVVIDTAFNSCNVTVQAQTGLSSISYTNGSSGGKGDITANVNITNIKYTESGFACTASGKATTGGKLTGSVTMSGKASGGALTGISHDA